MTTLHRHFSHWLSSGLVAFLAAASVMLTPDPAAGGNGEPTYAYLVDVVSETLYRHTLDLPGVLEPIAPLPSPGGSIIGGCETLPGKNQFIFCIDAASPAPFLRVDLESGMVTTLGVAVPGGSNVFTALATDPTTGILYATTSDLFSATNNLYTLNPQNGSATLVGSITNSIQVTAAAFDATGQLYVYDGASSFLLAVDETTAEGTAIGLTGFTSNFNASLDFSDDGTCYLWGRNAQAINELRTCDPSTGATTLVGGVGVTSPGSHLGLSGATLVVGDSPVIFADGFESGNTSAWSLTVE